MVVPLTCKAGQMPPSRGGWSVRGLQPECRPTGSIFSLRVLTPHAVICTASFSDRDRSECAPVAITSLKGGIVEGNSVKGQVIHARLTLWRRMADLRQDS